VSTLPVTAGQGHHLTFPNLLVMAGWAGGPFASEKTQRNRAAEEFSLWYLCFSAPPHSLFWEESIFTLTNGLTTCKNRALIIKTSSSLTMGDEEVLTLLLCFVRCHFLQLHPPHRVIASFRNASRNFFHLCV
jgi:hypothetical protein